jgi:probable F420-dependent oxidoreductase
MMSNLKFGAIVYPNEWRYTARIEELGYDSAWTSEHLFFFVPMFDTMTVMAAMAAVTERVKLGTAVTLLPLRQAAWTAKEVASVDIISDGRVILGVGVGGEYPKEFEAAGVPVKERGARTDEAIKVMKLLFTENNVTFEGRFTKLPGVTLGPKPKQPGGPPIWVAGRSEAAMRRAGRLGDGYVPYLFSPERFREGWAKVREYAEKAGRDPDAITPAIYQFIAVADTYEEGKKMALADLQMRYNQPFEKVVDRYVVMGNAADCARRLADFAEAGVEHFILVPIGFSPVDYKPQIEVIARDILPLVRKG